MSRRFVAASSQYLLNTTSSGIIDSPFTLAIRAKILSFVSNPFVFNLSSASATKYIGIHLLSSGSVCLDYNDVSFIRVTHGTTLATNVWANIVAVSASATSRSINYNNLTKVADTTNIPLTTAPVFVVIGAYDDGVLSPSNFTDGDLAEAAIWNVALDDAEQAAYMKGVSPLLIRPQSLVRYFPLYGQDSPERNHWSGSCDLSLVNAPTKGEHPLIYMPNGPLTTYDYSVIAPPAADSNMFLVF